MHQFLAAFFTLVFSFSNASSTHRAVVIAQHEDDTAAVLFNATEYAPSRQQLAQISYHSSYAGMACTSCRAMNVSLRTH